MKGRIFRALYGSCSTVSTFYGLKDEPPGYMQYFDSVYIIYREPTDSIPFQTGATMSTVLRRVVTKLLTENAINILCFGMKLNSTQLLSVVPNPTHLVLTEDPWEWLLGKIGERRMYGLLKSATIFAQSAERPMQLTGYPMSDIHFGNKLSQNSSIRSFPDSRASFMYKGGRFGIPKEGWAVHCDIAERKVVLTRTKYLKLLDYYCPRMSKCPFQHFNKVARFLFSLVCSLFGAFLGRALKTAIRKQVFIFIQLRRFEKISLQGILDTWKASTLPVEKQMMFVEYLFSDFIPKILAASFYITDTAASRYKLVFIRLDDWVVYTRAFKEQLIQSNLLPIGYHQKGDASGRLRFVPKETAGTFRPIMNMKKNNQLAATKTALAVLEFHKKTLDTMGASVTGGLSEVRQRLEGFKRNHPRGTRYYIAKVDVEKCFDRIPIETLLEFVERLIDRASYTVHRFDTVKTMAGGEVVKRFLRIAAPTGSLPSISAISKQTITIDRCSVSKPVHREAILQAIKDAILHVQIHYDGVAYKLRKGIPQGSILSPLLCSLFYSQLDKLHFMEEMKDRQNILMMRYIDDMIIISPLADNVERIMGKLSVGFPEFGFFLNPDKSLRSSQDSWFPWCGMLVGEQLEVMADFTRFSSSRISDHLTVEYVCNPGKAFLRFTRSTLKPRINRLFFNNHLNSFDINLLNLQDCAALLALRLLAYVREHDRINTKQPLQRRTIERALAKGGRIISRSLYRLVCFPQSLSQRIYCETIQMVFRKFNFKHSFRGDGAQSFRPLGLLRRAIDGDMRL